MEVEVKHSDIQSGLAPATQTAVHSTKSWGPAIIHAQQQQLQRARTVVVKLTSVFDLVVTFDHGSRRTVDQTVDKRTYWCLDLLEPSSCLHQHDMHGHDT